MQDKTRIYISVKYSAFCTKLLYKPALGDVAQWNFMLSCEKVNANVIDDSRTHLRAAKVR